MLRLLPTRLILPLLFLALLLPGAARAQAVVSAVLDATGVSDTSLKRLQRTTEAALKQVSSLNVGEGPAYRRNSPRRCEDDCAQELAQSVSVAGAVLLSVKALDRGGERISVEVQLWLDGEKVGARRGEGTVDGFDGAIRPVLESLLPGWARQGYGGLRVEVEPGTVVKVDGRLLEGRPGEVVPVAAGMHQVDVVFPEGHAVLQRIDVPQGGRAKVQAQSPAEAITGRAPKKLSALRGVSYGTFMVGAAVLAGGLVAGALGRGTAADLGSSCQGDYRSCATLQTVLDRQAQAQAYATTGNVMLGVGGGLAATGAVLFLIDALTE